MHFLHDVIIIGAGPCGLGLAARLCEQTPAAHYTDEEHRRYHWIRKHQSKSPGDSQKKQDQHHAGSVSVNQDSKAQPLESSARPDHEEDDPMVGQRLGEYHTLIIDATAKKFLSRWDSNFQTFDIQHLRSPMFFHVDPADRDGLLAFAQEHERYKTECEEIKGVVGQELSKHARKQRAARQHKHQAIGKDTNIDERQRQDYFVPGRELFRDHCEDLLKRYKIDENRLIVQDVVIDIEYGLAEDLMNTTPRFPSAGIDKIFKVTTWQGTYFAKAVVLSIGPSVPLKHQVTWPNKSCHSNQIREFPNLEVQCKMKLALPTNVIIVGGGLTSAQLALRAIGRGVTKVWLIMRGPLKIKHFDMTLEWVGKFKNQEMATFWSADSDEERLQMIKTARNGGSIPLKYKKLLDEQVTKGKLVIRTHTTLRNVCKNEDTWNTQTVITDPSIPDIPDIDYVYFATGPQSGLNSLSMPSCCAEGHSTIPHDGSIPVPFLETLQQYHPIHWLNGLPVLNNDLAWSTVENGKENRTIPLFMTGSLAALRLGPAAANLQGARTGAERVTWGIQDAIGTKLSKTEQLAQGLNAYLTREGGRFDGLAELDDY